MDNIKFSKSCFKLPTLFTLLYTLLFLLLFAPSHLIAGAIILTSNSIVDEAGNLIKSGAFNDLLFDGKNIYYILSDGIYSLDGKVRIDIKNAQRVGLNYVVSNSKIYRISNGTALSIGSIPSNLQNIYVKNDFIISLEKGYLTCYFGDKVVWSLGTVVSSFKASGNYVAAFGTQTLLINITNPQYLKMERFYPQFKDYAQFSEYHAFSDGTKIYIYKGVARLSTTFPYKGPLFSDGENLYSGNLLITPEMVQKDLKFQVKSLIPFDIDSSDTLTNIPNKQESTVPSTTSTTSNISSGGGTSPNVSTSTPNTSGSTTPNKDSESEKTEVNVIAPTESSAKPRAPKVFDIVWTTVLNDQISGKPAIKGKQLYIPTLKGSIINMSDGKINWTFKTGFVIFGHTTVGNSIYAVSWDDTVYSISENGELNWKLKLDSDISQGPAWDGFYLYVVTDNGTVYVIKDNIKSGKIENSYKTAAYPVVPPSVSLAGKIFVVDGLGNLWKDKSVTSFIGKVKNLPILYENFHAGPELGFTLIDEDGVPYQFVPLDKETQIVKGKTVFTKVNDLIVDAVLGKTRIYVIGSSGKLYVIEKESKKILFSDTVPGAKYIGLSNSYLYVFGKEIRCYYVNDNPTGLWNSLYANQFNWNTAAK